MPMDERFRDDIRGAAMGVRPDGDFDLPAAQTAREACSFRGLLPELPAGHDWEADARFHGLMPGTSPPTGCPAALEDTPWRS